MRIGALGGLKISSKNCFVLWNIPRTKLSQNRGFGLPLIFLLIFLASSFAGLTSLAIQHRLINQTGLDNGLKARYVANAAVQLTLAQLREDSSFLSPSGTWKSEDYPELKLSDPSLSFEVEMVNNRFGDSPLTAPDGATVAPRHAWIRSQ